MSTLKFVSLLLIFGAIQTTYSLDQSQAIALGLTVGVARMGGAGANGCHTPCLLCQRLPMPSKSFIMLLNNLCPFLNHKLHIKLIPNFVLFLKPNGCQ